jgi:hypothetical protein
MEIQPLSLVLHDEDPLICLPPGVHLTLAGSQGWAADLEQKQTVAHGERRRDIAISGPPRSEPLADQDFGPFSWRRLCDAPSGWGSNPAKMSPWMRGPTEPSHHRPAHRRRTDILTASAPAVMEAKPLQTAFAARQAFGINWAGRSARSQ